MLFETVRYDRSRHLLFVIHVRKTGGSSLNALLGHALPGGVRRLHMQALESHDTGWRLAHERLRRTGLHLRQELVEEARRLAGLPNRSVDTVAAVVGHVRLGSIRTGRRRPLPVALIRDPVDRLVSEYFYTRDRAERLLAAGRPPKAAKKREARMMGFDEWAESLLARRDGLPLNGQCAYFSRSGTFAEARRAVDEEMWLAAPTEELPRFAGMLGQGLGVDLGPVERVNAGRSRPAGFEPDPGLRRRLEEALGEDRALHSHVGESFARLASRREG